MYWRIPSAASCIDLNQPLKHFYYSAKYLYFGSRCKISMFCIVKLRIGKCLCVNFKSTLRILTFPLCRTHVLIHFNKRHLSQRLFNFLWNNFQLWIKQCTVKSVLSITVLSDHTCVSGRLSKSRTYFPEITVIFTSIKRSPLPSGRGRPWSETALLYFFFTCIEQLTAKISR